MPTPTSITDLSQTASSNYPAGSDSPTVLDDVQRAHASFIAQLRDGKGHTNAVTLASATTTDIGGQNSLFVEISGTTTITSLGTNYNGPRFLKFTGILTLTYNATSLILPGAASITTAAGDTAIAVPNQALNGWTVYAYQRAAGTAAAAGLVTASGLTENTATMLGRTTAGTGAVEEISVGTGLSLAAGVLSSSVLSVPVRQCVLSGPVDSSGLPAFGGSTGSTTVTAAGTLIATAANGYSSGGSVDRVGSITNPSWTGLSTNGTMYLYLDISANGTCTTGSTTLQPTYRWGGADVTTNNQFTFNEQEMVGKVGNGSVATQTYRVFVGEVTVAGGVVTVITWYALMRRYELQSSSTPSNTRLSVNHNLGFKPQASDICVSLVCTTTDVGYAVGDEVPIEYLVNVSSNPIAIISADRSTLGVITTSAYTSPYLIHKTTGVTTLMTMANWQTKFYVKAGW